MGIILEGILKQVNPLNIILLVAALLIALFLVLPLFSIGIQLPVAAFSAGEQPESEPEAERVVPPLQEYAVVSEQNLFHSKRKLPPKKTEEVVQRPEFVLYGTLIIDNLRFAYLSDDKAPRTTPGRGKRQTGVKLGQSMSGYVLKEVHPDRVVMVRGDDRMELKVIAPGGKKGRGGDVNTKGAPAVSSKSPRRPAASAVAPRPRSTGDRRIPAATARSRFREPQANPNMMRPR